MVKFDIKRIFFYIKAESSLAVDFMFLYLIRINKLIKKGTQFTLQVVRRQTRKQFKQCVILQKRNVVYEIIPE